MPRNSFIVGPSFKPYTYQDLAPVVEAANKAHQEYEDELSKLNVEAGVLDKLIREGDVKAREMYSGYYNDLMDRIDTLSKYGLTPTSRREMLDMKGRFSREITPIQNAYNARAEEIKEQIAGRAKGMVYDEDASNASLDRYIENPAAKYAYADSNAGYNRILGIAKSLSNAFNKWEAGEPLDDVTKTWFERQGVKPNEISQAIADIQEAIRGGNNIKGNNLLSSILADEMHTSGVYKMSKEAQEDYFNRVAPALWAAMGETKIHTLEDYEGKLKLKKKYDLATAAAKYKIEHPDTVPGNQKYYRQVAKTSVDGKYNTNKIAADQKFIAEVISDPSLLFKTEEYYENLPATGVMGYTQSVKKTINPTIKRLEEISKAYGIDFPVYTVTQGKDIPFGQRTDVDIDALLGVIKQLDSKIKASAIRNQSYILDITDPKYVKKNIIENARLGLTTSGKKSSSMYEIDEDGNIDKDYASSDEIEKNLEKNFMLSYEPGVGFVVTGTTDNGELHSYKVDEETITGDLFPGTEHNFYKHIINEINSAIEAGNSDAAASFIDQMMNNIYARFNSVSKVQGSTLPKDEQ